MTRFAALLAKNPGDPFGLTNYTQLKTDHDYLIVAGADQPSGATVAVAAEFFAVTGTTAVANLNDASGAAAGQQVRMWIKSGPLTFQNNGGGTGNIRTLTGIDTSYATNSIACFLFDGTVWRENAPARPGAQLDYAQITGNVTVAGASEAAATTVITGNAVVYDGTKVKLEAFFPGSTMAAGGGTIVGVFTKDGSPIGQSDLSGGGGQTDLSVNAEFFDTPTAASHTYGVKAFNASSATQVLKAGAGGSGVLVPAFLRVTKA